MHKDSNGTTRTLAYAAGFGIGALWIILAIVALTSALRGLANDRSDWFAGWGLVGCLLLLAGSIAIIGTWWHNNRVVRRH